VKNLSKVAAAQSSRLPRRIFLAVQAKVSSVAAVAYKRACGSDRQSLGEAVASANELDSMILALGIEGLFRRVSSQFLICLIRKSNTSGKQNRSVANFECHQIANCKTGVSRLKSVLSQRLVGLMGELICLGFSLWESAHLNKEAGDAKRVAGEANERASNSELARATLEKEVMLAVSPRLFHVTQNGRQRLAAFSKTKVIIQFSHSEDSTNLAHQIDSLLRNLKWNMQTNTNILDVSLWRLGVTVGINGASTDPTLAKARDALIDELRAEDVESSSLESFPTNLPPDTLLVLVGEKRNPFEQRKIESIISRRTIDFQKQFLDRLTNPAEAEIWRKHFKKKKEEEDQKTNELRTFTR